MAALPPVTPAFAWAHPDLPAVPLPRMKAKESPKPVSNPLLKRSSPRVNGQAPMGNGHHNMGGLSNGDPGVRLPFSPMDNKSNLRQRRKPMEKALLPPTTSLTEGSSLYLESSSGHERPENQPTGTDLVLWNDTGNNSSDDSWEFWVLVFGFSSKAQYDEVLRRFESFGPIVAQRGGGSNWVALRYDSYLEVEKALCQQTCVLGDGTVMGVQRMDGKMSQSLDWDANPTEVHSESKSRKANNGLGEDDVLLSYEDMENSKSSMCEKVVAFIFGWD